MGWIQRLTIRGRRTELGLGGFPLMSLQEARAKAFANRKLAREGGDPLSEKRQAESMPTFADAARQVWNQLRSGWRSPERARLWLSASTEVPLSDRAMERTRALDRSSPLAFPSVCGEPLASTALSQLLRELGIAAACRTASGCRSVTGRPRGDGSSARGRRSHRPANRNCALRPPGAKLLDHR